MSRRSYNEIRHKKHRDLVIHALGGRCQVCWTTDDPSLLEVVARPGRGFSTPPGGRFLRARKYLFSDVIPNGMLMCKGCMEMGDPTLKRAGGEHSS